MPVMPDNIEDPNIKISILNFVILFFIGTLQSCEKLTYKMKP